MCRAWLKLYLLKVISLRGLCIYIHPLTKCRYLKVIYFIPDNNLTNIDLPCFNFNKKNIYNDKIIINKVEYGNLTFIIYLYAKKCFYFPSQ